MVRELFGIEPDPWQADVLEMFPKCQRQAMAACKGPGKTALLAWLAWNFLLTRPHPKIAATSITADTLADTLWAEMAKWQQKSELLKATFIWQKTRIFNRDDPENWFMTARTWKQNANPEEQANTLAGLHADYIMFLIDEAGGVPDAVMAAAEAALSSCIEGHLVIAGNPTHLSGPLYRAFKAERAIWSTTHITGDPDDPKRSPRISIEWANTQITKYGRDNPWVLVNVFGEFPPSSFNSLIGVEEVEASFKRYYRQFEIGQAPKILGVDVAREGDDVSVIARREGIQAYKVKRFRNINSTQGAHHVYSDWQEFGADACFIDMTGGFGSGWFDQLSLLGKQSIGIHFSSSASNGARYFNKRVEMYFDFIEWIKNGGALPESSDLLKSLTQTAYTFKGDKLILEDKAQIKAKIGFSPDEADAFALTFAHPVTAGSAQRNKPVARVAQAEYDPFADMNRLASANDR
jgi:phage terminase large subunit